MPELIEHIDAIARQRGRAVLYLEFHPTGRAERADYRYEDDTTRQAVLEWLATHGHEWVRCGPFAQPGTMRPYEGQICLGVEFNESLPEYREVRDYLEFPNGNMRIAGVRFYLLTLEYAMRNAEHDSPGFWTRWAEQL